MTFAIFGFPIFFLLPCLEKSCDIASFQLYWFHMLLQYKGQKYDGKSISSIVSCFNVSTKKNNFAKRTFDPLTVVIPAKSE